MNEYKRFFDLKAKGLTQMSSPVSVGEMRHKLPFSWAPTSTLTNGGDRFFAVPVLVPLLDGNFRPQ